MTAASRSPAAVGPALWRMGRLLLHIIHGVLIVRLRFGQLDAARRHAEIGRWATGVLRLLHIGLRTEGDLADGPTLMVANHVSWLDIVVIHAVCPQARFVSKAVVGDWPVIGTLVTGAATLMVDRQRRHDTARALDTMVQALACGDTVAVFPEGTTSDGTQVLDCHTSLLHCAVTAQAIVQPVALRYSEDGHALSTSVPYVGTTSFVESLWRVCKARDVTVTIRLCPVVSGPHTDRRVLARELRRTIASARDDLAKPMS